MHSKEALTPVCIEVFQRAKTALPKDIGSRLTSNRHIRNHGSYRTFYLFGAWDVHQADILRREHFCYNLCYFGSDVLKDRKNDGKTWSLQLWINTIRLYRNQQEIREILEKDLKKACPKGFQYRQSIRAVELKMTFEFDETLAKFPDFVVPHYIKLIRSVHPVLLPIIDSFTQPLTKEERAKVILGRKRIYFGPASRPSAEKIREYTRSIPASWRPKILAEFGGVCVRCKEPLTVRTAHMDHILPFSKGGGTTFDNLQPLCEPCNLRKGNRENY